MRTSNCDRLATTTYRDARGYLCSKLNILDLDITIFYRAWRQAHEDFDIWFQVRAGISFTDLAKHYNITVWDIRSQVTALNTIVPLINAANTKLGRDSPTRKIMERLVVYTNYLRGPVPAWLAIRLNELDTEKEQQRVENMIYEYTGALPEVNHGISKKELMEKLRKEQREFEASK
jgi:hypothetical protein